jgi:hypothetical protein
MTMLLIFSILVLRERIIGERASNMDFHINKETLAKSGISVDMAFYLASIYFDKPYTYDTFDLASKQGLITYNHLDRYNLPIQPKLTREGVELVESIFLNSEFKGNKGIDTDRYDELADKLRELYPKGRKEGTSYLWRDSHAKIANKLRTLVKKYNFKFTDEQAINATKRYIESFNGNYSYMQLLKYFILKKDKDTGEENSQLMSYIENEDCTDAANDDWMNEVR